MDDDDNLLLNRHLPEASPRDDSDLNPRRDAALDFADRDLGAMRAADYRAIGFLAGLEVHQQLATRGKLFCRCPSGRRVTRVDGRILRHMRPTLSELGKYDACALMEFKTRKDIVYLLERESVCTYELDDTPPFEPDAEAVDIALEVSMLFRLNLVSELHFMRKQYLDGSIPTGFQRTALTGVAGQVPFRVPELGVDRPLTIRQISLEEDSCREVANHGHTITFRTDRLGTPLTETVTEPELLTPFELQAGARLIARTAQATGKVRRGAGAARQDVNVSVAGGRRVEIKGVWHTKYLPRLVHLEAFRQLGLLRIKAELERRGLGPDLYHVPGKGAPWAVSPLVVEVPAAHLSGSELKPLTAALARGERAAAVRLRGFGGILGRPTQPGLTFAHELSERIRVIACLDGFPLLVHSDDGLPGIPGHAATELGRALKAETGDAVVVIWGPTVDLATAAREVLARAAEAFAGVPSETRVPHLDGTTGFERLLPGPERMYPDTDTPPLAIADARVETIALHLPEPPWERAERWQALGLEPALVDRLLPLPTAALFDAVAPRAGATARRLGWALVKRRRRTLGATAERLRPVLRAIEAGDLRVEALEPLLDLLAARPEADPATLVAARRPRGSEEAEVAGALTAPPTSTGGPRSAQPEARMRWAMGRVMPALLGRADPALVRRQLEPLLAAVPR